MSKIYCGAKETPKGSRLGTLQECQKTKQLRRYGIQQIDRNTLMQIQMNKSNPDYMTKDELHDKIFERNIKLNKLKNEVENIQSKLYYLEREDAVKPRKEALKPLSEIAKDKKKQKLKITPQIEIEQLRRRLNEIVSENNNIKDNYDKYVKAYNKITNKNGV